MLRKKLSESFEKLSNAEKERFTTKKSRDFTTKTLRTRRRAREFLGFPRERTKEKRYADLEQELSATNLH